MDGFPSPRNLKAASNSMRSPCLRYVLERALEFACTQYGVKQAYVFTLVLVDSDVHETGVFVTLELVDRIVHQRAVEHAKAHQQFEIFYGQAGDLLEQS